MGESLPIRIYETLHTLLEMYTYPHEEVLVIEAIANGIDAKAHKIDITFYRDKDEYYIIFHNNGPPMNKQDFENYHTISLSSKTKGQSIGFAGVGAKIFLASDNNSEIVTITGKNETSALVSRMYNIGKKIEYETSLRQPINELLKFQNSNLKHKYGTTYQVKLTSKGYSFLKQNITKILQFWFNSAIISKRLEIAVDGIAVRQIDPLGKQFEKIILFKKQKIPCYFWISEEEICEEQRHIVYTVLGKRIKNEQVDFSDQIAENMSKRVCCMPDVSLIGEFLNSNKEDFQKNKRTNNVKKVIKKAFYDFLRDNNLIKVTNRVENNNQIFNDISERINMALQSKELKFLNPFSNFSLRAIPIPNKEGEITITEMEGSQRVSGIEGNDNKNGLGTPTVGDEEGAGFVKDDDGDEIGENKERKSKGINISREDFPGDFREGWIDIENKGIVYNIGHKFSKLVASDVAVEKYNFVRVIIFTLIKNKNDQEPMDALITLQYVEKLLHEIWV